MAHYWNIDGKRLRIYTPLEAANYCGGPEGAVSVGTISYWRRTGWLRSIPVGRGHLYLKEYLDECLELKGYSNRITEEILV